MSSSGSKIIVIGLGYVGLPLAVALAKAHPDADVIGFDIDASRIAELRQGEDRTREVEGRDLSSTLMTFTDRDEDCAGASFIIVTVPTPVDDRNQPDLSALLAASKRLAGWIEAERRPTIIFESTVYPGATEEECGPLIEQASGLQRGRDFRLGYSPERINPGDKVHRVDKIIKVISGEDEEVLDQLEQLYGTMTEGGVFRAASIRTAEAAKAIENAQRDINIAFMNEVAQILSHNGVSTWDVIDAARTKWNFLPFEPGLVGGHCIGVDPYYLSFHAQRIGHDPRVILAGRGINDDMGRWIADRLHTQVGSSPKRILFLGITFKENVPDVRNSRAVDIVRRLAWLGHEVTITDPLADPEEVNREYQLTLEKVPVGRFDCIVAAVRHAGFEEMSADAVAGMVAEGGLVADLKGMWRKLALPPGVQRWSL
ncbi:nucleotide sugar dehydrogenase [Sphingomonas sp. RB56-2]|uniref:Nucleotide sugar dehydrogenase n=1 Tax=Sphingomonas brevis TaxID=2908206 RepID=A0ABT0S6X7_9SPHN|nr:nucleotide sugar dehydrogenase [Sphingomonas brevis]MCL6739904.1 nucleotide sugar dehydrogenase [Sphingomonas brevis]